MRLLLVVLLLLAPVAALPPASAWSSLHFGAAGERCSVEGVVEVQSIPTQHCPYAGLFGYLENAGCAEDGCDLFMLVDAAATDYRDELGALHVEATVGWADELLPTALICAADGAAHQARCEVDRTQRLAIEDGACRYLRFVVRGEAAGSPFVAEGDALIHACRAGGALGMRMADGSAWYAAQTHACEPTPVDVPVILAEICSTAVYGGALAGPCSGATCELTVAIEAFGRSYWSAPKLLTAELALPSGEELVCVDVSQSATASCERTVEASVDVAPGECASFVVRATLHDVVSTGVGKVEKTMDLCRDAAGGARIVNAGW